MKDLESLSTPYQNFDIDMKDLEIATVEGGLPDNRQFFFIVVSLYVKKRRAFKRDRNNIKRSQAYLLRF